MYYKVYWNDSEENKEVNMKFKAKTINEVKEIASKYIDPSLITKIEEFWPGYEEYK